MPGYKNPPKGKKGQPHRSAKEQIALMNLIRRKLIDAKSPAEIAQEMQIPLSTFYDYYRKIAKEDKEAIKYLQNADILSSQFMILYDRLHKYLQRAENLAEHAESEGVRVNANNQCNSLAVQIMRLHVGGPQAVGIKVIDEDTKKLYKLSSSSAQIAKEAGLVDKLDGYTQQLVDKAVDVPKDDALPEA